jgi:hypothetical protein
VLYQLSYLTAHPKRRSVGPGSHLRARLAASLEPAGDANGRSRVTTGRSGPDGI